ncbi:hypothetical protein J2797_003419 [Paraburkholderia terricola]|uniref:NACHT domain-containing protein n=1 Tax=Paraburkholderia terricola TaxID=169427 RepID=UPI0028608913|nr:NACHT domain-containing protein [Paraburkholderia terricola]MDR6493521.1 hypothetical protein [Paraburkholderia terricola]
MAEEYPENCDAMNACDALRPVLSQFKARPSPGQIDIRESIALVDFHLKVVYTLVISFSRRPLGTPIKMSPVPGFGSMLAVIRQGAKLPPDVGTQWIRDLVLSWSTGAAAAIDLFKTQRYKTFKTLRDRLAHGQPLPSDEKALSPIRQGLISLIDALERLLEETLRETTIVARDGRVHIHKKKERAVFEVSPLWIWSDATGGLRIYSHVSSDGIHYVEPSGDIWSNRTSETVTRFLKTYVGESSAGQAELGKLVKEVIADIAAYTEDYSRPSYFFGDEDDSGNLFVPWTRSTSEGNQSRIDAFRVGPNDRKEWRSAEDVWLPYYDFLKNISNWEILARRVAIGLDSFSQERAAEESSRLGLTKKVAARGPSQLKRKKDALSPSDYSDENFDLKSRIDDSCQRMKPSTSVYFLIGQAGLGKTELMVSLARERAKEIELNPALELPLYLFVSSTGRTLSSLEDAVNSALNITKLLSSQSAKALCRNGLLVLLVDGFDELLGSSGYENALGSLEPWFRELGGRGVLVASARSSYYLTQYRRSLAQAVNLNVDHTLAELQPWSRAASEAYLREMGVTSTIIAGIKNRDWNILSVPFFAKAFAAWLARAQGTGRTLLSIYEIVVEQYLEREARKLTDPNAGPLLNAEELRVLFTEVAELMQGSKNREIDQADLVACAEVVVNTVNLESARPGLTRRLSSLCGLGVSPDSSGQNQFGFSHEVLFDCFLSLAIQQRISNTLNVGSLLRLLSTSTVNASVFEWLVEKKPEAIALLAKNVSFRMKDEEETRVLSANLGALWEAMLVHQNGVPATAIASGLQLERINLARDGWRSLDLSGSVIGDIVVRDGSVGCIDVSRADISFLRAESSEQAKCSLKGIESANVHSVHIGDRYGDSRKQVREILGSMQLVQLENHEGDQEAREAALYFLDRLARRPDAAIILYREDLSADDQRLSWINHFEADQWRSFVNALTGSGVASLEPLSTSGRPKVRLSFNKPVASLLSPDESTEEILKFWREF